MSLLIQSGNSCHVRYTYRIKWRIFISMWINRVALQRYFGLKYRSINIWTGWATWLATLTIMGWIYSAYILVPSSRGSIESSSFLASFGIYDWTLVHDDGENHDPSRYKEQTVYPKAELHTERNHSLDIVGGTAQVAFSTTEAHNLVDKGLGLVQAQNWTGAIPLLEKGLSALEGAELDTSDLTVVDKAMYGLARSYAETNDFSRARRWIDSLYTAGRVTMAEPAYHLCRRLREVGQNTLAFYYYLLARALPRTTGSSEYIRPEPGLHEYLLDYEKSILWSYIGDISERHSRLHGLSFSMDLLEKPALPDNLRGSVFSNLQYYAPHLRGFLSVLCAEKSVEEEWRYSTPTFIDDNMTLIRVVNYYVADDGSYHVSAKAGNRVNTQLVLAKTDAPFEVKLSPTFQELADTGHLIHPDAYILGLEDTRVVRDAVYNNTIFTLSASQQYSNDGHIMKQVLGVLDLQAMTHTIENVVNFPQHDHVEKNWVFAGGIDNVIYEWYPAIAIGGIDRNHAQLRIHTTISSPVSFREMRGSTNGALYEREWWFVTHSVIYRHGQMRKYLHHLVVLDESRSAILRYSLPFTFEEDSDVEYCLGLKVDESGLTFGYSVRDRSSRILHVVWRDVGELF